MTNGVSIQYGDIAVDAKENFNITVSEKLFDTIDNLQKYNMQIYNYAMPCEMYQTALDGTCTPFSDDIISNNIGLWSTQLSDLKGEFITPVVITLESNGKYSSQGFTFTFDKFNDIYPTKLTIQWFRDGEDLSNGAVEFNPTSGFYFCKNKIENFNKVIIKFYSLNMPNNRLKVEIIDYGYGTIFYGDELSNVSCIQELNPISYQIPSSTMDFVVNSKSNMVYSFKSKQPLITRHHGKLICNTFITNSKRISKHIWEVKSQDYIGIMDNIPYVGGLYVNENAYNILVNILTTAKVPYSIDENVKELKISGYIPYTTCREALTYVLFAIQYVVSTNYTDIVKIYKLSDNISQNIDLNRIMQGQEFEDTEIITGVEISVYAYSKSNEYTTMYTAEESGTGTNILIKFNEPIYDLEIGYEDDGKFVADNTYGNIIKSHVNYMIIDANESCVVRGKTYTQTETKQTKINPVITASQIDNISVVTGNTLITSDNAQLVLENCYNYLLQAQYSHMTIVERRKTTGGTYALWGNVTWGDFIWGGITPEHTSYDKDIIVGDKITVATEYLGNITGIITKQTFKLNGNNINKECSII